MPQPAVELYLTQEKANAVAKAAAAGAGPGADFAVRRMTPAGWVEELWELWGDGRVLVNSKQRSLLVGELLANQSLFLPSHGAVELMGSFFGAYASRFGEKTCDVSLSRHERAVLDLARDYEKMLEERFLVEIDSAACALAADVDSGAIPACAVDVVDHLDLTPGVRRLLRALSTARAVGSEDETLSDEAVGVGALPEGVVPEFLVPAGPGATASLVRQSVMRSLEEGCRSCLVCGPNADVMASVLCAELAARGIGCAVRIKAPVLHTDVAHLWKAVSAVVEGPYSIAAATDVAGSPLVGLAPSEVRDFNTELRSDRLISPEEVERRLRALSPLVCLMSDAMRCTPESLSAKLGELAAALEHACNDVGGYSVLDCRREQGAAKGLSDLAAQAVALGVHPYTLVDLWLSGTLRVEAQCEGNGSAMVEFATPDRLRSLVPGSYDEVVLSDLSTDSFRARAGSSSLDELAERLGWTQERSAFDEQRLLFVGAQMAARLRFSCVVPLRTAEGDPAYPSFLLKEYLEALAREGRIRAEESGDTAMADAWTEVMPDLCDIPRALAPVVYRGGEDALVESVGADFTAPLSLDVLVAPERGRLERLRLTEYLRHAVECGEELVVLSPSAIELYLGCPYSWFIQRRIGVSPLGEQFSPLEKGTFVHAALASFYDELAARGRHRVDREHVREDAALMNEVLDQLIDRQQELEPAKGRLVAISSAERLQIERLRQYLLDSLRRQSGYAGSFIVREHEHKIDVEDGIDYAGVRLNGSVDRVDVNLQQGQFYVIDYKGSLGSGYSIQKGRRATDEPDLPNHPQAYMYAQALRQTLDNLHCVGALYLSYKAKTNKDMMAGAVQKGVLDDGAYIKSTSVFPANFDALLDRIEQQIREGLEGIYESDIAQRPRYKDVCTYCPVPQCERRQSESR